MPKRLAAALLALLTFAPALAVITASPASAHPLTTTKQRCSYDPFAGQQCWNETVSLRHVHGPQINNKPANVIPPGPCPAGTTGTPPNCYPTDHDTNNGNTGGDSTGGDSTGGDSTGGDSTGGDSTGGDSTGGDSTGGDSTGGDSTGGDSTGGDSTGGDSTGGDSTGGDSTGGDSTGGDSTGGDSTGGDPEPTTTTTTSNDPCGDYTEDLVDALSKAGHTGTYNPPAKPDGCAEGPSTSEIVKALRAAYKHLSEAQARALLDAVKLLEDAPDTAKEAAAKAAKAVAVALQEEWSKLSPEERELVKQGAVLVGCGAVAVALFKGGPITTAAGLAAVLASPKVAAAATTCGVAVNVIMVSVQHRILNNDEGNGQGDDDDDAKDDADDGKGDDDGGEPKLTPAEAYRRALRAWIADPSPANAAARQEAAERYKAALCRQGQKAYC